jgi:hypothetical protein
MGRWITTPRGGARLLHYGEYDRLPRSGDQRPDPEDAAANAHANNVRGVQDARSEPRQVIRGAWPMDMPTPPGGQTSWVDIYNSPRGGFGYVVNYESLRGINVFRRAVNYGPETERDQDWARYVEPRPL